MNKNTFSVCSVCKKRIQATYENRNKDVFFVKECPKHGSTSTLIWEGRPPWFSQWTKDWEIDADSQPLCPDVCGPCDKHISPICCAVLEVTDDCNLSCNYCLAGSGNGTNLAIEEIFYSIENMYKMGVRSVHLIGGEPTLHPNLPQIISYCKKLGFDYIQLNTNGIRTALDDGYIDSLVDAGLSNVFLQFDGTTDEIYKKLRGEALLDRKLKAIEHCKKAEIGVTLVPTVTFENIEDMGNLIRFAIQNMPTVRGIHFQPVAYMGRVPDEKSRVTLPLLLRAIEQGTDGLFMTSFFAPSVADAPLCGFHGEFRIERDGAIIPLEKRGEGCCCGSPEDNVKRSREFVRDHWGRTTGNLRTESNQVPTLDELMSELNDNTLSLSAMAFMDKDTLDVSRLMQCSLRLYKNGVLTPFCLGKCL